MADDIDDLLNEVEQELIKNNSTLTVPENKDANINLKDELNFILDDIEEKPVPNRIVTHQYSYSSLHRKENKCLPVFLSGTALELGHSKGSTLRACDKLRCLSCDMCIIYFNGFMWNDDVDYLFLRNNFPDRLRMSTKLAPHRKFRAYACQCRCASFENPQKLDQIRGLKWLCGKHM